MEKDGNPLRSVILTTWRSGSTFLGDILNAHPANFYHYEPLLHFGIIQIREPPLSDGALDNLNSMFRCDYSTLGIEFFIIFCLLLKLSLFGNVLEKQNVQ